MNERTLCRIWRAQRFGQPLVGSRSEAIEIVYRGYYQSGGGPDFREAIVSLDGQLQSGDVEVHVHASDWWLHGHHHNPSYNRVILHVVLHDDCDERVTTAIGDTIPTLALHSHVGPPETWWTLQQWADPSCRAGDIDPETFGEVLDRLGDDRFAEKAKRYEAELATVEPEEALYRGIMEALGYSRNGRAFRDLASRLPASNLFSLTHRRPLAERTMLHQSLLFGVAGLLPSQRQDCVTLDWPSAEYADDLDRAWKATGYARAVEVMETGTWVLGGTRPLNSPVRRIGAAGHLLASTLEGGPVEAVLARVRQADRTRMERLRGLFTVDCVNSYWTGYYDFGHRLGQQSTRLIGTERARDIALNAALPFALAYASARDDETLASAAWAAYRSSPNLAHNEITRRICDEVLTEPQRQQIRGARRQQGILHLHNVWCDRRLCSDCPLGQA